MFSQTPKESETNYTRKKHARVIFAWITQPRATPCRSEQKCHAASTCTPKTVDDASLFLSTHARGRPYTAAAYRRDDHDGDDDDDDRDTASGVTSRGQLLVSTRTRAQCNHGSTLQYVTLVVGLVVVQFRVAPIAYQKPPLSRHECAVENKFKYNFTRV